MNQQPTIQLGTQKFTIASLPSASLGNEEFQRIINFCNEWLGGKQEFIIHTSGSTGTPKVIVISREQMKSSVRATAEALRLQKHERFLVCLNTNYIAGKMMLVRGLELEAEMVVVAPHRNPLLDFDEKTTWFDFAAFVPLQLQTILDETPEKIPILNQMKAIIVGGAPVSYALLKKIRQIKKVPIYATYGMTETVTHIALKRLNGKNPSDWYHTLPHVHIRTDERGCLVIRSPQTNFEDVVTNDLVKIHNEREFEWLGRIDFVINTGGVKVFPEKIEPIIERIFYELALNRRFFVGAIADEHLNQKVVLIIEGIPFARQFEKELLAQLKKVLPTYHEPKQILYLERFVYTSTDKIDRKASMKKILNP